MDSLVISILQVGAIGAVLVWHLVRTDSRMERMERALDRTTRSILMLAVTQPGATAATRAQARAIVRRDGPEGRLDRPRAGAEAGGMRLGLYDGALQMFVADQPPRSACAGSRSCAGWPSAASSGPTRSGSRVAPTPTSCRSTSDRNDDHDPLRRRRRKETTWQRTRGSAQGRGQHRAEAQHHHGGRDEHPQGPPRQGRPGHHRQRRHDRDAGHLRQRHHDRQQDFRVGQRGRQGRVRAPVPDGHGHLRRERRHIRTGDHRMELI
jgi:hypothetical protein